MKTIFKLILSSVILINLPACNTVKGFGQDMQQGGQELQKAATDDHQQQKK